MNRIYVHTAFFLLLWPCLQVTGQPPVDPTPLAIGDKMPSVSWKQIRHGDTSVVSLDDIDEPYILFDFWNRYCHACLNAMPKLDTLQRMYAGRLKIISVSDFLTAEEVTGMLGRFTRTRGLSLPNIYDDHQLHKLFPLRSVPHLVWLGPDRKVQAITEGGYAIPAKIDELIAGNTTGWKMKIDRMDFDGSTPMLALSGNGTDVNPVGYSILTGYLAGTGVSAGMYTDSLSGKKLIALYNQDLFSLCQRATGVYEDDGFVFKPGVKEKLSWNGTGVYAEWAVSNTFCYQFCLPDVMDTQETELLLQADLRKWLGLMGISISRAGGAVKGKPGKRYSIMLKTKMLPRINQQ